MPTGIAVLGGAMRSEPAAARRRERRPVPRRLAHPVTLAAAVAALLCAGWLAHPTGGDLAAQVAHARFAAAHPGAVVDLRWYGGFYPAAYSVLGPAALAVLGVRLGGALATIAAAMLVAAVLVRAQARRARAGSILAAVALAANLASGRASFALGTALGLGALLLLPRSGSAPARRGLLGAALLAAAASLASPVAGGFVVLAGLALVLGGRARDGVTLGAGAAVPLVAVRLLLPQWGVQPMSLDLLVAALAATGAVGLLLPRERRTLRVGCLLYAVAIAAAYLVASPVGSNVTRLGLVFAGPVLVACTRFRLRWLTPAFIGLLMWQGQPAFADLTHDQGRAPSYDAGIVAELELLHADRGRVEAVPQRQHWESAALVGAAPLARGWERQLDVARNPGFYRGTLTAAHYRAWLVRNAVGYVARSDREPDWAGRAEAALLRAGQPWLRPVWHDRHWQLWRVVGARPLVDAPARIVRSDAGSVTVRTSRPADVVLRIRWSPWLRLSGGPGCLFRQGEWTGLHLQRAGAYRVGSGYALPRGSPC